MELGLRGNEVKIVSYTDEWQSEFLRVKKEIHQQTKIKENRIEHIGSTAIKGMSAKPIVDIVVAVDDLTILDSSIIKGLKAIGFLRLRVERPGEIVFAKFTDDSYEEKTHYIHLVEYEKELWKNLIFFRDYLNKNENARKDYTNLKLDYLAANTTGIKEYTDYKDTFVKNIFKKRLVDSEGQKYF